MINSNQVQEKLVFALGEKLLDALKNPLVTDIECNEDGQVWIDTLNRGRKKYAQLVMERRTTSFVQWQELLVLQWIVNILI